MKSFAKPLTANDTGETGGHQAGILIPKGQPELMEALPYLDPTIKNPDFWITCIDEGGTEWSFRYVYYNNKLHDEKGTRNEYRITHMTKYFRSVVAKAGDVFIISVVKPGIIYNIKVQPAEEEIKTESDSPNRIRLKGWRRIH